MISAVHRTYDSDSPNLIHEQRWDDVAGQHSQTAQEADHVDDDVVLLIEVQMAAFLWVEEGGVLHLTVLKLFLPEVCREQKAVKCCSFFYSFFRAMLKQWYERNDQKWHLCYKKCCFWWCSFQKRCWLIWCLQNSSFQKGNSQTLLTSSQYLQTCRRGKEQSEKHCG